MKALFIIGILLLISGFGLAYAGSRPLTSLSDRGEKAYTACIVLGIGLIGAASIMYLRKTSK